MNRSGASASERLDAGRIRAALPAGARLGGLAVHGAVDSTNTWLLERAADLASPYACLGEHQRAGRGRRGRVWTDASGRDLCLSLLRRFASTGARAQGLSLAVGVAAVRALVAVGARAVGLKWPNDIVWRDRKLGGILIEGSFAGPVWTAVIGIGLNVRADPAAPQPPGDRVHLESLLEARVSRNRLAALILAEVLGECVRFETEGAGRALEEWRALDATRGREVTVDTALGVFIGVARGVDDTGELLVETHGTIRRFASADVSLRIGPVREREDVA